MSKNTLEQLFGSRTRLKILRFLFRNEGSVFAIKQLAQHVQESRNIVKKELRELKLIGLIKLKR